MQESKSLGLGSAFGGDSSNSLFGTSTADVLKKFTGYLATIFIASSLILSIWTSSMKSSQPLKEPVEIEAPVEGN